MGASYNARGSSNPSLSARTSSAEGCLPLRKKVGSRASGGNRTGGADKRQALRVCQLGGPQ